MSVDENASKDKAAAVAEVDDLLKALWQLIVNCSVPKGEFEPSRLLACFQTDGVREEDGIFSGSARLASPPGMLHLVVATHDEGEALHYHVVFIFDFQVEATSEGVNADEFIHCVGSHIPGEIKAALIARMLLNAESWATGLGLPRVASGLIPGVPDGGVQLSGVELDFSNTGLPLDGVAISTRNDEVEIEVRYRRKLNFSAVSATELLREATELGRLFLVERSVDNV